MVLGITPSTMFVYNLTPHPKGWGVFLSQPPRNTIDIR